MAIHILAAKYIIIIIILIIVRNKTDIHRQLDN